MFVRNGTNWIQQAKLTANDAAAEDFFGASVTVSGDTALVGAPGDDDAGDDSGSAYVNGCNVARTETTGTEVGGARGFPRISSGLPVLGTMVDIDLDNASPDMLTCIVKGRCNDDGIRFPACGLTLYVNGGSQCTTTDSSGHARYTIFIPNLPVLCGKRYCFQHFVLDFTSTGGCGVTQSLTLVMFPGLAP